MQGNPPQSLCTCPPAGPVEATCGGAQEKDLAKAFLPIYREKLNRFVKLSKEQHPLEGVVKHRLMGPNSRVSDQELWNRKQEFTFLTHSQVLLMLPVQGPHWEPQHQATPRKASASHQRSDKRNVMVFLPLGSAPIKSTSLLCHRNYFSVYAIGSVACSLPIK